MRLTMQTDTLKANDIRLFPRPTPSQLAVNSAVYEQAKANVLVRALDLALTLYYAENTNANPK